MKTAAPRVFPGMTVEDERTNQRATVLKPNAEALASKPEFPFSVYVRWEKTGRKTWTEAARLRRVS